MKVAAVGANEPQAPARDAVVRTTGAEPRLSPGGGECDPLAVRRHRDRTRQSSCGVGTGELHTRGAVEPELVETGTERAEGIRAEEKRAVRRPDGPRCRPAEG